MEELIDKYKKNLEFFVGLNEVLYSLQNDRNALTHFLIVIKHSKGDEISTDFSKWADKLLDMPILKREAQIKKDQKLIDLWIDSLSAYEEA